MASLPQQPSLNSPAGEPTIFRQQRLWGRQLQEVVAQHEAAFQGRYLPQGRLPGVAPDRPPPHLVVKYDGTTVQVGIGRAYAAPIPEFIFVNYRGALIEIAMPTVENVATTASGYIVYEVTCAASVWAATAVYVADITTLADPAKIYIPIAKVIYYGAAIQTIYQILADNPVVEVGSPQYSISVDSTTGRLQFLNDQAVPPPMSIYATDQNGVKGWHPLCPLVDACAGGDPEDGQPCGDCAALPTCYEIDSYAATFLDPDTCTTGTVGTSASAWDGKLTKTSSSTQPCAYSGDIVLTLPGPSNNYLASYSLVQYLDGATCTWRLTFLTRGFEQPSIIWQGEHTSTDPDDAAFTRVAGCDTTASITLTLCSRRIRVTFSGITVCCLGDNVVKATAASITAHNAVFEFDEDSPGSGTWTNVSFLSVDLDTYNSAPCTGGVASTAGDTMAISITYDEATTWVCSTANNTGYSVVWFSGTDAAGDATGASITSDISGCVWLGYSMYSYSGSCTIEVL